MRDTTVFLAVFGWACGSEVGHDPPPIAEPAGRIAPGEIPAALDAVYLDCDGDRWLVVAEVAGRAHAARAVLARDDAGAAFAWELPMVRQPLPEGSLWQRYEATVDREDMPCDRVGVSLTVEALDESGRVIGRRVRDGRPR